MHVQCFMLRHNCTALLLRRELKRHNLNPVVFSIQFSYVMYPAKVHVFHHSTGILSQVRTKLRDWTVWQARAVCYSQAALSSNDSKTLVLIVCITKLIPLAGIDKESS